jgi:hypothetical protein
MPDEVKQPEDAAKQYQPAPGEPDLSDLNMAELWDEDDYLARTGERPRLPGEAQKLYEVDGLPVRFGSDVRQLPERLNPTTKQWEPFAGLTRVAFEGTPLSEAEFQNLVEEIIAR